MQKVSVTVDFIKKMSINKNNEKKKRQSFYSQVRVANFLIELWSIYE